MSNLSFSPGNNFLSPDIRGRVGERNIKRASMFVGQVLIFLTLD
jgi:hypothetical protein